jgi:CheY-like chemotaxis protein
MGYRILAIDDDPQTTHGLKRLLEKLGYEVLEENDSTHALQAARDFHPDIVILDYMMPLMHGGDVAWQFASDPYLRRTRVIVCSGVPKSEIARRLPPAPIPIVEKPLDSNALLVLLKQSMRAEAKREQAATPDDEWWGVVGY